METSEEGGDGRGEGGGAEAEEAGRVEPEGTGGSAAGAVSKASAERAEWWFSERRWLLSLFFVQAALTVAYICVLAWMYSLVMYSRDAEELVQRGYAPGVLAFLLFLTFAGVPVYFLLEALERTILPVYRWPEPREEIEDDLRCLRIAAGRGAEVTGSRDVDFEELVASLGWTPMITSNDSYMQFAAIRGDMRTLTRKIETAARAAAVARAVDREESALTRAADAKVEELTDLLSTRKLAARVCARNFIRALPDPWGDEEAGGVVGGSGEKYSEEADGERRDGNDGGETPPLLGGEEEASALRSRATESAASFEADVAALRGAARVIGEEHSECLERLRKALVREHTEEIL